MPAAYTAKLRNFRVAPRKARLVANLVRGKHVQTARNMLRTTHKKSAPIVAKLLDSALSNIRSTTTIDEERLVVKEIFVEEGPTLRRFIPRARGRASPIRKRTSHIVLKLGEL